MGDFYFIAEVNRLNNTRLDVYLAVAVNMLISPFQLDAEFAFNLIKHRIFRTFTVLVLHIVIINAGIEYAQTRFQRPVLPRNESISHLNSGTVLSTVGIRFQIVIGFDFRVLSTGICRGKSPEIVVIVTIIQTEQEA